MAETRRTVMEPGRLLLETHNKDGDAATLIYTRACTSSKDNGEKTTLRIHSNVYFSAP
jgi:cell division inhibitor SulA